MRMNIVGLKILKEAYTSTTSKFLLQRWEIVFQKKNLLTAMFTNRKKKKALFLAVLKKNKYRFYNTLIYKHSGPWFFLKADDFQALLILQILGLQKIKSYKGK